MLSESFFTQLVIAVGVVLSAFFALLAARYRYLKKPKDQSEVLFAGYESLLKRQESQYDHQQHQLANAWQTIERLQEELDKAKAIIDQQRADLSEAQEENRRLLDELRQLKDHYSKGEATGLAA